MSKSVRILSLICIFLLFFIVGVNAYQNKGGKLLKENTERSILRNQHGAVIRDSNQQRINYSRQELENQALEAQKNYTASAQTLAAEAENASVVNPIWSYAAFQSGVGLSNIIVAQNGAYTEIYTAAGFNAYWLALRYNPANNDYEQVYVSHYFSSPISRIEVANIVGDSAKEIITTLQDGRINIYSQADKTLLATITTGLYGVSGLDVADADGDGANELIICTGNHLYAYSGGGVLKWDLANVGGVDLLAAQMDGDSALEIATTDGHIVDGITHAIEWTWSYGFGRTLEAADIDGDGMQELIEAEGWQFVWAYDVDRQLPKWSISTSQDIGAIYVTDIDGDSVQEVLVGQGQWGSIVAYDTVTQSQKWEVHNPEHGVTNIATGDVDGDGSIELIWGAGASSSGEDHLYVANWQTKQIEWQNVHLDGPFSGPEVGDLDGDGHDEMVIISRSSDAGYDGARVLVFDAVTRRLRLISESIGGSFSYTNPEFKLRDVDNDGRKEIVVAANSSYNGTIQIYSFDTSNTLAKKWTNATNAGSTFNSVDAADVDNDGQMEIVGSSAGHVYVYGYNTNSEEWKSLYMRGTATALEISDVDQDGHKEIIAMVNDGDVYIFDGVTKELETIFPGPFIAMRLHNISGVPKIVLGKSTGNLLMFDHSSGAYSKTYDQKLINGPINGITFDSQGRAWLGSSPAQYTQGDGTLYQVTLSGTVLASYSGFGSVIGLRVAFVPAALTFYTTTGYSVVGFSTCSASLSTTNIERGPESSVTSVFVTAGDTCYWEAVSNADWIHVMPGHGSGTGNGSVTFTVEVNVGPARVGTLTVAGQTLTVTQPRSEGTDTVGVYDPSTATFKLKFSHSSGVPDRTFTFGPMGGIAVAGDWDGDGYKTIGVFKDGFWHLKNSNGPGNADIIVKYGATGDQPIAGDWDGDGRDGIGVFYSGGFYLSNSATQPAVDYSIGYGRMGDIAIAGDWNGDGIDTIGVYNPAGGAFFLTNSFTSGIADYGYTYGPPAASPVMGDWNGDRIKSPGIYTGNTFFLRNSNTPGYGEFGFAFGSAGLQPIAGNWLR